MATPNRKGVGESGEGLDSAQRARLWVRDLGGEGGGPSSTPSPAKVRQAQRRYRSLFQKAAKEVSTNSSEIKTLPTSCNVVDSAIYPH